MNQHESSRIADVEIKAGRHVEARFFSACLGKPSEKVDNGQAILILHEIYGLNPETRRLVDCFVAEGYTALAPDLLWEYGRNIVYPYDARDAALKAAQSIGFDNVMVDIAAAYQALVELVPNAKQIAVMGYGWSCKPALMARPQLGEAPYVMYYPGGLDGADELLASSMGPTQFHFAGQDARTPENFRARLAQIYKGQAGFDVQLYEEAQHGFANSMRPEYSRDAATLAESRALRWLTSQLR